MPGTARSDAGTDLNPPVGEPGHVHPIGGFRRIPTIGPPHGAHEWHLPEGVIVITLGVVLLIIGFIAKVPVLWSLGILLAVIGAVLYLLGSVGREVGGRRHYF